MSQEGESKAGRGNIVTDKKHSPTVPEQEEQCRSSGSNRGEPSDHQTSTAMRQVQGQSRRSEAAQFRKEQGFVLKGSSSGKAERAQMKLLTAWLFLSSLIQGHTTAPHQNWPDTQAGS